jgi:hypothetical protein
MYEVFYHLTVNRKKDKKGIENATTASNTYLRSIRFIGVAQNEVVVRLVCNSGLGKWAPEMGYPKAKSRFAVSRLQGA